MWRTFHKFDSTVSDFKYWEDGSDEFRYLEGSLLPLWKFHHDRSRAFIVSDVCWSPVYPDLLAAAYTTGQYQRRTMGTEDMFANFLPHTR